MKSIVFFRFDASPETGLGHLRRCAVLARELMHEGSEVCALARCAGVDMSASGWPEGTHIETLPWGAAVAEDARVLAELCGRSGARMGVLDHYRMDEAYQTLLAEAGLGWMQFGNPAHTHPILGQVLHDARPVAMAADYEGRLRSPQTRLLFGPRFALLDPAFARERTTARPGGRVTSVLLTFGGGNDGGATLRALDWLTAAGYAGRVEILATRLNPNLGRIEERVASNPQLRLHVDNWSPAPVMAQCQMALTAGGTTLHELACLGVPALVLSLAENQREPGRSWEQAGLGSYLGDLATLQDSDAARGVGAWLSDDDRRAAMAERCQQSQDGLGARRVAEALLALAEPV